MRAFFQLQDKQTNSIVKRTTGLFESNSATIDYQSVAKPIRTAQKGVKKFVQKSISNNKEVQLFEDILKGVIESSPQRVSKFNLDQIVQYYPWLFSSVLLIDPIPYMLFGIKYDLTPQQYDKIESYQNKQTVKQIAYKCIYESLHDGAPYIQSLLRALAGKTTKYQLLKFNTKQIFTQSFQKLGKLAGYFKSTNKYSAVIWKGLVGASNITSSVFDMLGFGATKKKDETEVEDDQKRVHAVTNFLNLLYSDIFSQLRVYGQLIINYGFLKAVAKKKLIDGKLYYNFLQTPTFYISNTDSLPAVYVLQNNKLVLIPQKTFTLQYFRQLTSLKVVKLGGQIFADYKNQLNSTQEQKKSISLFKTTYLSGA